jgi:hypothetical protein
VFRRNFVDGRGRSRPEFVPDMVRATATASSIAVS